MLYSDPLLLLLTVLDENDNMPVFTQDVYQVAIEENTAKGKSCPYAASQVVKLLWWPTYGWQE